uniref:Uncharacterized protein n=1 Tax=Rhizophora mucronata TaxID=61149 RepID=A0A2P2NR26_RHIMU
MLGGILLLVYVMLLLPCQMLLLSNFQVTCTLLKLIIRCENSIAQESRHFQFAKSSVLVPVLHR